MSSLLRSRPVLALLLGPPALALAALAAVVFFASPATTAAAPAAAAATAIPLPASTGLLIDVAGAVARPGQYRVVKGERVSAAIAAAGGLAADADPARLPDMAAVLKDGQQIRVPAIGSSSTSTKRTSSGSARIPTVSLNSSTAEQLALVPGFTPDLAAIVVDYRTQYGGFTTTRELVDVLNMSEADYARAKPYLRL